MKASRKMTMAALLIGLIALIAGCKGGSGVLDKKPIVLASGKILVPITISGKNFKTTARTLLPDPWTEDLKDKLYFTLTSTVLPAGGINYSYKELRESRATVELEEGSHAFTMTAYTDEDRKIEALKGETTIVVTSTMVKGNNFIMKPVIPSKGLGEAAITVVFVNPLDPAAAAGAPANGVIKFVKVKASPVTPAVVPTPPPEIDDE